MAFLSMHSEQQGKQTFGCATRYDWYLVFNVPASPRAVTWVRDEHGQEAPIRLREWPFLPNAELALFPSLFDFNQHDTFDVLFSRSAYGTDKPNVSKTATRSFRYPCVHSMNRNGITLVYSNTRALGQFGVPKVILSFGRYQYPYNDWRGELGMSQIAFGLVISSKAEGDRVMAGLNHPVFLRVLRAVLAARELPVLSRRATGLKAFQRDDGRVEPQRSRDVS